MQIPQIQQVRRFNRLMSQRIDALQERYLHSGRLVGQARLLYEVGTEGVEVRVLRERLGLDSGCLSQLLRALESQGLVRVHSQASDARVRRVSLTPKGQAERETYDELSDDLATSLLSLLGTAQQERSVAAMAEIERLLRIAETEVRVEAPGSAAGRW